MNTILTDDERPKLPKAQKYRRQQRHDGGYELVPAYTQEEMEAYAAATEAAVLAKLREQEPVVEFMGRRQTPEGTRECWGVLLCDFMQDPAKGTKLYVHPPTSLAESPKQWRSVMPGGKLTDKWDSARVADYNQGWNDYRKAALRNLESAAPLPAVVQVPPIPLNIIRKWPDGFDARLQHVWKDVISFIPNVKLWDLQRVLAEFGFRMEVYDQAAAPEAPATAVVQVPQGVDVEGRRIAAEAENHACSLAVWMTRMDAESPDADDLGVSGWLQEAEERIKRRMLAAAPEAPAQEKSNG